MKNEACIGEWRILWLLCYGAGYDTTAALRSVGTINGDVAICIGGKLAGDIGINWIAYAKSAILVKGKIEIFLQICISDIPANCKTDQIIV